MRPEASRPAIGTRPGASTATPLAPVPRWRSCCRTGPFPTAHLAYLAEVLAAEVDDRTERPASAGSPTPSFPRIKRLADFNIDVVPTIEAVTIGRLASGAYLDAGEPVVVLVTRAPVKLRIPFTGLVKQSRLIVGYVDT